MLSCIELENLVSIMINYLFSVLVVLSTLSVDSLADTLEAARGNRSICSEIPERPILPKVNSANQFVVGIGIYPISIKNISPEKNNAEIDFYLTIEYPIESAIADVKCVGDLSTEVWNIFYNPDIEFMSISNPEYLQGQHWMIENGRFAFMTRAKGNIDLNGDFRQFPFDKLSVKVSVAGEDSSKYLLLTPSKWYHSDLNDLISEFSDLSIPGWSLVDAFFSKYEPSSYESENEFWDEVILNLEIEREPTTYVARTVVPLLVLYLIAFFSFLISDQSGLPSGKDSFTETRVAIQVGTLLALFAYCLYLMDVIPETSYLTLGDLTWSTFMASVLLVIFSEYLPNEILVMNRAIPLKKICLGLSLGFVTSLLIVLFVVAI